MWKYQKLIKLSLSYFVSHNLTFMSCINLIIATVVTVLAEFSIMWGTGQKGKYRILRQFSYTLNNSSDTKHQILQQFNEPSTCKHDCYTTQVQQNIWIEANHPPLSSWIREVWIPATILWWRLVELIISSRRRACTFLMESSHVSMDAWICGLTASPRRCSILAISVITC